MICSADPATTELSILHEVKKIPLSSSVEPFAEPSSRMAPLRQPSHRQPRKWIWLVLSWLNPNVPGAVEFLNSVAGSACVPQFSQLQSYRRVSHTSTKSSATPWQSR